MSGRTRLRRWSWSVVFVASSLVACTQQTKKRGELMVAVSADMSIPENMNQVVVEALDQGGNWTFATYPILPEPLGQSMPGTLAVIPHGAGGDLIRLRIRAERDDGRGDPKVRVVREAVVRIPADRTAMVTMPLRWLCDTRFVPNKDHGGSFESDCGEGQTCAAGACIDSAQDDLPEYDPTKVFGGGTADGGGTCMDVTSCFKDGAAVVPDDSCTIAMPASADASGSNVNVALSLGAGKDGICDDGRCLIALDKDDVEGFRLADGRIQLPRAVCNLLSNETIDKIVESVACPSKNLTVPICGPWTKVTTRATVTPKTGPTLTDGGPGGPLCGNGIIDPSEDCDGTDLNRATCNTATLGLRTSGNLSCTGTCRFDLSGCAGVPPTPGCTELGTCDSGPSTPVSEGGAPETGPPAVGLTGTIKLCKGRALTPVPASFPDCDATCGGSHCVPAAALPNGIDPSQLPHCNDASLCIPDDYIKTLGDFAPLSCRSVFGSEGRCLSTCLSQVSAQAVTLPQDVCASGERCAPCFDPIQGTVTHSCDLGCDPGPQEPPTQLPSCGAGLGLCIPPASVPKLQLVLPADTCTGGDRCIPAELLTNPGFKFPGCGPEAGLGGCVPGYLNNGTFDQESCQIGFVCAPCVIAGAQTGACN